MCVNVRLDAFYSLHFRPGRMRDCLSKGSLCVYREHTVTDADSVCFVMHFINNNLKNVQINMFLAVYKPAVCQWRSDSCTKVSVTLSFFYCGKPSPSPPRVAPNPHPASITERKKACYLLFAIVVLVTPATQYLRLVFLG